MTCSKRFKDIRQGVERQEIEVRFLYKEIRVREGYVYMSYIARQQRGFISFRFVVRLSGSSVFGIRFGSLHILLFQIVTSSERRIGRGMWMSS